MLKYIKKQISELLQTLTEAEQEIQAVIRQDDEAGLMNILADAQDAAVAIGGRIEEAEGIGTQAAISIGEADGADAQAAIRAEEADGAGAQAAISTGEADGADAQAAIRAEEPDGAGAQAVTGTESVNPDGNPAAGIIQQLEQYCEFLWKVTQTQEPETRLELVDSAWKLLRSVGQRLEEMPEQMAVVFMPYKASMWDSMESVWLAACEDPDCVPYVVPIPYFDLKDGEMTARHYEGGLFPNYVQVTHYSDFSLEELHPEAIFVHNPFDGNNTVTSVLPQFYSGELKKVTDRLVYIPYYITGEAVYRTHRYLPAYENMDFIVTQCEKTIDSFSTDLPRAKFLPFGSPIADRVLRLEREKPEIPEEWKPQLKNGKDFGGNRVVMLNASITMMMGQRKRFLDKIEYLIELIRRQKGISVVWRPHPLLAATAKNMGEEYAERLAFLEDKFLKEKIGVLDKTPDVGITVALCDAYLGETSSSVLHMFGIARKPRFYINTQIPDDTGADRQEDENRVSVSAWCKAGGREYYVLDEYGWVVVKEPGTDNRYLPLVRIPGREIVRGRAYRRIEVNDGCIWVYPENAEGIFIYDTRSGGMRKIFRKDENGDFGTEVSSSSDLDSIEVDEQCISMLRAEKFKWGNLDHIWYEGKDSRLEDYIRFLRTAEAEELKGTPGPYLQWIANLDGSCGEKVLQAVKESCFQRTNHD